MEKVTITGEMLDTIYQEIPANAHGKLDISIVELPISLDNSVGVIYDAGYGRKYIEVSRNGNAYPSGGLGAPDWAVENE